MTRRSDWPEVLAAKIEDRRFVPFAYGSNDCALFAADVVLAMTGEDPAAGVRGTYDTETGALRRIASAGGMANLVDLPQKHPGLAQRGDLVLAEPDGRQTFGIVAGNGYWCAPGPEGLVFRPMSEVLMAFGV